MKIVTDSRYALLNTLSAVMILCAILLASPVSASHSNIAQEPDGATVMDENEIPVFKIMDLSSLRDYVDSQIVYPPTAQSRNIEGTVEVAFVVRRNGHIDNVRILKSPDESLSNEVIRIMEGAPDWEPKLEKGKRMRYRYMLPVEFKLK